MSRQLAERGEACLVPVSPAHGHGGSQDEVKLAYEYYYYYCAPLLPLPRPRARWLAARGENFTTPSVYSSSLLRTLVSTPSIYLYKATIKKYILHLYKATNSNRDKSYYSLLSSLWLNFKISPTKVDGEWSN